MRMWGKHDFGQEVLSEQAYDPLNIDSPAEISHIYT